MKDYRHDDSKVSYRIKYGQVCDDVKWNGERLADAFSAEVFHTVPTVFQVTTYMPQQSVERAVMKAINRRFRI